MSMRRCLALLLLAACRGREAAPETAVAAYTADSVVWGEDRARAAARDPGRGGAAGSIDRLFLEQLLDHYQGLEYLAERVRQTSNVSAVRRAAWRFDRRVNSERREADALLREIYGERYLPLVPGEFRSALTAIRVLPPDRQARALLEFVSRHHREDVALIDSVLPTLEHPKVRELARELRRDERRDLRVFARSLAKD